MARPTKYLDWIHPAWAQSLAMEGLIEDEIAERMGIVRSTLNKWKNEKPEFSDAIKMGKEPADSTVKVSLFKRANGYSYKEKQVVVEMDKEGNQKPARIITTEKVVLPDVTAQIFWLKNRKPTEWKDKHEVAGDFTFLDLMKQAANGE
jgi:hypothetical protein